MPDNTSAHQIKDCSAGLVALAKLFKERENPKQNEPVFGKITSLEPLQIQLDNKKILIEEKNITSLVNLFERRDGVYINSGKTVAMLMYNNGRVSGMPDFLVLGVVTYG